jgi:hypothetical protein
VKEQVTVFLTDARFTKLQAFADANQRIPDDIANCLLNEAIDALTAADMQDFERGRRGVRGGYE